MSDDARREQAVSERARRRAADLAAEYRADGWVALAVRPANVVPIPVGPARGDERDADADVGVSFLLPVTEFDLLAALDAGGDLEGDVVRESNGERDALVVVLRDDAGQNAIAVPLWLHRPTASAMAHAARERGHLDLLVRAADADRELAIPLDPASVLGDGDDIE